MIIHKNKPLAVHTWDWKEQPDMQSIADVITGFQEKFSNGIRIIKVETNADDYAIVIGDGSLTDELAKQTYNNRYEIEEGIDGTELDWKEAEMHLKEIRRAFTEIGTPGIPALTLFINPLLLRLERGERSKGLHDAIMDLN